MVIWNILFTNLLIIDMLIFIDLDGTITNTVHPSWKPYKDGQENYSMENYLANNPLPVINGAKEFIASR